MHAQNPNLDADLLIAGGTLAAVACALEARRQGLKVLLATSRPYLGEDVCAFLRYWPQLPPDAPELARSLFAPLAENDPKPPTPFHIKQLLESRLLDADIPFLFNTAVDALLLDGQAIAGAVLVNRGGRHRILCRQAVDATWEALLARRHGLSVRPRDSQSCEFVVVGSDSAEPLSGTTFWASEELTPSFRHRKDPKRPEETWRAWRYHVAREQIPELGGGSGTDYAAAAQKVRLATWRPGQAFASEELFALRWRARSESAPLPGLYVLGPCADIPDAEARALVEPAAFVNAGTEMGRAVAQVAGARRGPGSGGRPSEAREVTLPTYALLGDYDVVVIGGGTGGASAGISAARSGARTLVCEQMPGLGGVGTLGLIGRYWFGNRVGFTEEIDKGVAALMGLPELPKTGWDVEAKMHWYLRELDSAGGRAWFGALCFGVDTEEAGEGMRRVSALHLATPWGIGKVRAKFVIDATGSADVAALAGAPTVNIEARHVAVQGTGLPPRDLGANYTNTDHTFADDNDSGNLTQVHVTTKAKFPDAFDMGQLIDTRERRRIVGEYEVSAMDIQGKRPFPDVMIKAYSNFDTHGFTVHPFLLLKPPAIHDGLFAELPLRSLLPRGLENVLVTGLGVSAHRDAMPVIRMQADVQNQGYVTGIIVGQALSEGRTLRRLDIRALQRVLVEKGVLESAVLQRPGPGRSNGNTGFSVEDLLAAPELAPEGASLRRAVEGLGLDWEGLHEVFSHAAASLPFLREALAGSEGEAALRYALVLGMMGDATGLDLLLERIRSTDWDQGWNYRGMGQFGASGSDLDNYIIAAGLCGGGDSRALSALLPKVSTLPENPEFSHCRALAIAFESLAAAEAAPALAALLEREGMRGHCFHDLKSIMSSLPANRNDTSTRNASLRELVLARAIFRCGDTPSRLGESTLQAYARDLRGHYARHAAAVLAEGKRSRPVPGYPGMDAVG